MFSSYNPPIISSIYLQGLEISAADAKNAAVAAQTSAESARDEALAYRNETHDYYTQVQQVQTGDYVTSQSLADALGAFGFADLASVPEAFTPTEHMHSWSEITGKPNAFTPAYHTHSWAHIADKPAEFEPAEHLHTWQQIAQKPGTFPPEAHYHGWADIENKPNVFNPAAHTHAWGDISGKPTKFEPVAHTHEWDSIENKPLTFPPASHTHDWSTVTGKPVQATRWPSFSEVTGKPSSYTPSAHGHAWDEITGKPATATQWPSWAQVSGKPDVVEASEIGTAAARNVGEGAGDVVTVGFSGLGSDGSSIDLPNWSLNEARAGFYEESANNVIVVSRAKARATAIIIEAGSQNAINTGIYISHYNADSGQEFGRMALHHSGNADFETFGGGDSNEKLASGYAKFSNFAVFEVKLNNVVSARNIEVNGTFEIVDKVSGDTIVGGINGLSLSGTSSNKEGVIVFSSGGSIFTKGQSLELYSGASGAYFKVA